MRDNIAKNCIVCEKRADNKIVTIIDKYGIQIHSPLCSSHIANERVLHIIYEHYINATDIIRKNLRTSPKKAFRGADTGDIEVSVGN